MRADLRLLSTRLRYWRHQGEFLTEARGRVHGPVDACCVCRDVSEKVQVPGHVVALGGLEQRAQQSHLHRRAAENHYRAESLFLLFCQAWEGLVAGGGGVRQGFEVALLQTGAPLYDFAVCVVGGFGVGRAHEGLSLERGRGVDEVAESGVDACGAGDGVGWEVREDVLAQLERVGDSRCAVESLCRGRCGLEGMGWRWWCGELALVALFGGFGHELVDVWDGWFGNCGEALPECIVV